MQKQHIHKEIQKPRSLQGQTWLIVEHILVSRKILLPIIWCPHLRTSKPDPGLGSLSYSIKRPKSPQVAAPYCRDNPHFNFLHFHIRFLRRFTVFFHVFPPLSFFNLPPSTTSSNFQSMYFPPHHPLTLISERKFTG